MEHWNFNGSPVGILGFPGWEDANAALKFDIGFLTKIHMGRWEAGGIASKTDIGFLSTLFLKQLKAASADFTFDITFLIKIQAGTFRGCRRNLQNRYRIVDTKP